MKKRTKITIAIIVGILLIASLSLNVVLATECGFIKSSSNLSGSVNESWRSNAANIECFQENGTKFYSNNDGDYIYNVYFSHPYNNQYCILYDSYFNTFDDIEVYFVVEDANGVRAATPVEKTHSPIGNDRIEFSCDLVLVRIIEVWVRTLD